MYYFQTDLKTITNTLPGYFVMKVKQINSQSDLIPISNFAGRLISQSDRLIILI